MASLQRIAESSSRSEAWQHLENHCRMLGIDYAGFAISTRDEEGQTVTVRDGSPDFHQLFEVYQERQLGERDVAVSYTLAGKDIVSGRSLTERHMKDTRFNATEVATFLQDMGIQDRASLSINLPNHPPGRGSFAFGSTGSLTREEFAAKMTEAGAEMRLAASAFLLAAMSSERQTNEQLLTPAERRTFQHLSQGRSPKEIARREGKSLSTIRQQINSAKKRLGAQTTAQAISIASQLSIVSPLGGKTSI